MSFLDKNSSEYLSARLTQKGRNSIANGDFKISYFSVGDSEYVYDNFSGSVQNVLSPLDKDGGLKYPLLYESGSSILYGVPVTGATSETISNQMGSSGIFSGLTINTGTTTGSVAYTSLNQASSITINVNTHYSFKDSKFVTLALGSLNNGTITGYSNNFTYKVLNVVDNGSSETLTLDRSTPNLSSLTGNAVVIGNYANIEFPSGSSTPTC